MSFLSKTFKYVNLLGQSIVFDYAHGYLISKPDGIDTISVTANTAQGIGFVFWISVTALRLRTP